MGKIEGGGAGTRHVTEAQLKMLPCPKFCSAMESGLDGENWKFLITESNKKVKITKIYYFFPFFSPQKEETRIDFENKAKN